MNCSPAKALRQPWPSIIKEGKFKLLNFGSHKTPHRFGKMACRSGVGNCTVTHYLDESSVRCSGSAGGPEWCISKDLDSRAWTPKFTSLPCSGEAPCEPRDSRGIPPPQKTSDQEKGFQRGWCTNCQNLREQQNVSLPRIALAMIISLACARIVGFDRKEKLS